MAQINIPSRHRTMTLVLFGKNEIYVEFIFDVDIDGKTY